MMPLFTRWKHEHLLRLQYAVPRREPFFAIAQKYLPTSQNGIIVDIGPGDGAFAKFAHLESRKNTVYLLDQNQETIQNLKKYFPNAQLYVAPQRLPFDDKSVAFVHMSHIVEHLYHEDLYAFLKELDRVLAHEGILVFSTPLLWDRFYDDMSHIKPYNPQVFLNYLCSGRENASSEIVSKNFVEKELVYRYRAVSDYEWGSRYFFAEVFLRFVRVVLNKLGFRKYIRNGYTLVLQKEK